MQKPDVGKRSVDLVRAVNTPPNIPRRGYIWAGAK